MAVTAQRPERSPARRRHPSRGPARVVSVRIKAPDFDRLAEAADSRGLAISSFVRDRLLDGLDELHQDGTP